MIDTTQILMVQTANFVPSGWVLTLVSVMIVFGVLLILFVAYALIGRIFTSDFGKRGAGETGQENGDDADEAAAVALALHMYLDEDTSHDNESGIITIRR